MAEKPTEASEQLVAARAAGAPSAVADPASARAAASGGGGGGFSVSVQPGVSASLPTVQLGSRGGPTDPLARYRASGSMRNPEGKCHSCGTPLAADVANCAPCGRTSESWNNELDDFITTGRERRANDGQILQEQGAIVGARWEESARKRHSPNQ